MREMKDSGIPWIGEIPKDWEVCRLKNLFRLKTGTTPDGYDVLGDGDKICWFTPSDISEDCNELYDSERKLLKDAVGRIELFPKGSLMFVGIGSVGKLGYTNIEGYSNQQITALIPKNVNSKYYFYYLIIDKQRIKDNAFFTILPIINNGYLSQNKVLCPPIDIQSKIASFLDRKCAEVDEMIALQEQIIEELKAYKQSVITEAVTKGLNPDVPMKDSGIEWIGQIPEHWEVKQFRRLFDIKKIIANELGYDVLSVTQGGLKVKDLSTNEGQMAQDYSKYQLVGIDDYVMNHMDLLTGFVDCSKQIGVTSPDYRVFKAKQKSDISLPFFLRIFQTCYKLRIFYHLGQGVAGMGRWRLPAEQLKLFLLPIPSLAEQQAIADYLDEKCADIDSLIQTKQSKIDSLKEYKKSIIYEYVTGKREV